MTLIDQTALAAIGLGLDAPAFDWAPGVGLRWTLPVGSTIHDPGVNLSGQVRGWPDNGYRIYRADAGTAISVTCADLETMRNRGKGSWAKSVELAGLDVTIDWTPSSGSQTLGAALGAAKHFTLRCDPMHLGLRIKIASTREGTKVDAFGKTIGGPHATIDARVSDRDGSTITSVVHEWTGTETFKLAGPGIARVDVDLSDAVVIEICILTTPSGRQGRLIHTAYPATTKAAVLASPIANRLDTSVDWSNFASYVHDAVANIDARLAVAQATTNPSAAPTSASDTALVDLLLLFAVDPTIAWLLGLLWWDTTAVAGQEYVYWIEAQWNGELHAWPIGPIGPAAPYRFSLPQNIDFLGSVLPALLPADADGPTGQPATAVGLSWRTGNVPTGPSPQPADVTVRWRVGRHTFPFGTPSATVPTVLAAANAFTPIAVNDVIDMDPATALPYLARDAGFAEGEQWWELTGLDLFGRPALPVRTGPLDVWDERVPPPPERLTARWIDAAGASPATAPSDPLLTTFDVAWLSANVQAAAGALYVGWEWSPALDAIAPGVREFRLYAQPANSVSRLSGTITSVISVAGSPEQSDVLLDTMLPTARFPFVGGTLSDGRGSFPIVELAAASETANRIRVLNTRDMQPSSPAPAGSPYGTPALVQSISPATYTRPVVATHASAIANIRPARAWADRLAIIPKPYPLPTSIAAVLADMISGDSRQVTLRLANQLVHPNSPAGVYADSGTLVVGGDEYRAQLVTLDAARTLPTGHIDVVLSMPKADTRTFPAGAAVTLHPGVSVYLTHPSYRSGGSLREYALVTVTSANGSTAPTAVDDPVHAPDGRWRESGIARHGFESVTASPVTIIEVARTPPAAPAQPAAPLLTSWPDAAGIATFTLAWQPQTGLRYVVLRAAAETLYASDRVERNAQYGNYAAAHPTLAALSTAYPSTDATVPDYAGVFASVGGAALLQSIASLEENAGAFTPLMASPQGVDECTIATPPRQIASAAGTDPTSEPGLWLDTTTGKLVYTDTLAGIGTSAYFYRILAVDSVGNRSPLSPSTLPVTTRVKALPRPAVVTGTRFGDSSVTLLWQHPSDGSADRYLVYTASSPAELSDLDLLSPEVVSLPRVMLNVDLESELARDQNMELLGTPPALPVGLPAGVTQWGWIGDESPPIDTYIAIVTEKDMTGGATLRSTPTAPLHVRPIEHGTPEPPELELLDRSGPDGGHVEFSIERPWHKVSIEIRGPGDRVWRSLTKGFVAMPASGGFDFAADPGVRYAVRLRAQNGIGLMSATVQGSLA